MKHKPFLAVGALMGAAVGLVLCFISLQAFIRIDPGAAKIIEHGKTAIGSYIKPEKITTLYFVGDIMLDRSVRTSVMKNFGGDYNRLFDNVADVRNADILFGNLEGPVSDAGNNVGSKYSFRMDPAILPALFNAGFDIVSFANNHAGDWNFPAFNDTIARLSQAGILHTGAGSGREEAEMPTIIEKNGIKFGFIGFSDVGPDWLRAGEASPGILLASDPRLPDIIREAKEKSDILIASFHWGEEYKQIHNARQETLAHMAIDSGADMVVGHHPHVMEDIETYNGKPIVYSLGNFIFDQYFSKDTMRGMLYIATFEGKNFKGSDRKTIILNEKYQPEGIFEAEIGSCPWPKKHYEDYSYLDVGQVVAIPDPTYIPSSLIELGKSIATKTPLCLKKEAAESLARMIEDAKTEEYDIKVSSAFRSFGTQKAILEANIKSGNKNASIAIAKPGYSEHQLGVAVDLTSPSIGNASATKKFEDTKEAAWLEANSYKYGFIQSYPEDKLGITGYMYEAWHYRYVGINNAKEIITSSQTINEFLRNKKQ